MTHSIHRRIAALQRRVPLLLLAGLFATAVAAGCEQGSAGSALGISPGAVTMSSASAYVTFAVGSGTNATSLPLEWTVSNPYLGRIVRSEGLTATYVRFTPNGRNSITVKDQNGVEGIAMVYQVP